MLPKIEMLWAKLCSVITHIVTTCNFFVITLHYINIVLTPAVHTFVQMTGLHLFNQLLLNVI